ncbi:MAG: ABC transporter ATP-binding protein [Leptolyngbyaceae cyanobacterium MO_188.B28]|nr:ABC transporter ATP-binding protein [Leptolyngbyaceae cyanobacterium MO_188.B28]
MLSKLPDPVRNLLKATRFWRDNYLILKELKPIRWLAISGIVFSCGAALMAGVTVSLMGVFLQGLFNPSELSIQTGVHWFDVWVLGTEAHDAQYIFRLAVGILLLIWLRSGLMYLGAFFSRLTTLNLVDRLRRQIFEQLQSLSLSYFSEVRPGDLMNTLRGEVNQIQQAFGVINIFISQGSSLLVFVGLMFLMSWQLSIASVMIFSLLSVGVSTITRRVREASFEVPKANKQFTSNALEFINGIRTVHASATQDFERRRFRRSVKKVLAASLRVAKLSLVVQPLTQGVSSSALIVMIVAASNFLVAGGQLQSEGLITFLLALSRTLPLVSQLNGAVTKFNSFQGALGNVNDFLRLDNKPYLVDGSRQFTGLERSLDFVSVDFGYDPEELVLHDITLSIKQGETTALVGSSGAGKTTLADLLPRFYDATQGQVLIDGVDLREFEINTLRRKMAIVSQDTFIFNTSARANIAYGLEEIDEDAMREAARQANALDFILELPEGFDTQLGDRGVRLSGGQRQRIAIARALLRSPDILILDEATSALDSVTERLIQESLEKLSKGRTVIAIAHRLSTIASADKVVVLEQGRIVEQGSYQELLDRRGKLWDYHQIQYELEQSA